MKSRTKRKRGKGVTLHKIAQIVGKSHVQVFRVLAKRKGHYSQQTEQKVYEAIKLLKQAA